MAFRHELKHRMNYSDYMQVRSRLKVLMKPDEHAGEAGEYRVRSLYFDNYYDKALKEKLNGINHREKFRIRLYNADTEYILLEKKSKIRGLCQKESVQITKEETEQILTGRLNFMRNDNRRLLPELYSKMKSQVLRPMTIVDYLREPYVFAAGNVRVTIDRDIRTGIRSLSFLNGEAPLVQTGATILMEVKYDGFLPDLIRDAVQLNGRFACAYSKYAVCRMYG